MKASRLYFHYGEVVLQAIVEAPQELLPGICCIAAPVFAPQGHVVAALAISLDKGGDVGAKLRETKTHFCYLSSIC